MPYFRVQITNDKKAYPDGGRWFMKGILTCQLVDWATFGEIIETSPARPHG